MFIDDVMLEVIPQNDLAALSITGNSTPTMGVAANYSIDVFNWGSIVQNTYLVKLYKQGDIEIGSAAGTAVNPGQTISVSVGWTPDAEGLTTIYGKVILAGDQNNLNDNSPSLAVTVQPPGLLVYTVGDGSETGRFPVDMYYMNSLFECMYYPAELGGTIGTVFGIGFYNNFASNLPNMPTNVWMGTTTQADLSAGWIPSTQLTQVFGGTVNYPSGTNLIHIPFTTPYLYLDGQNLVIMVERPMDTQYYSYSDLFATQTLAQSRARNAYSDNDDYDPASPPDVSATMAFPQTSFFIIPGGVGHLNGTVLGAGNQPLAGVAIASTFGGYSTTTNAQGQFSIINIVADTYQFNFSHYGYISQTQTIIIPEDQTIIHNLTMQQMPMVTVGGTIIGSDTGTGLNGAGIHLQGYETYNASTNAQGVFSIPSVYANNEYSFTIICPGYQNHSGTINVGATNYSFGTITLNEVAYAPRQVHGEIIDNNTHVSLSWLAPDPSALDVVESFEGDIFPPASWTQVINNTGAAISGVLPTWCRFGSVTISGNPVLPPDGSLQSGLWWSYEHQDEWLTTPTFNCPPSAYLTFASYVFLGSDNGDHYYIKVSIDDGATWTTLWDATAMTGGWNYYASPITIDLSSYEGMQLKLAWNADDPTTNDGLWYVWFIDDIYIGNAITAVRFAGSDLSRFSGNELRRSMGSNRASVQTNLPPSRAPQISAPVRTTNLSLPNPRINNRALVGYQVWRLNAGQEASPNNWTSLTPATVPNLNIVDENWLNLANGNYRWAVKAVYTSEVLSVPSFSNTVQKQVISGYISGVVRNAANNQPIAGASITAGSYSATSNSVGAYSILIPIGVYDVMASATNFVPQTSPSVTVVANQTTTVNFQLAPGGATQDEAIPVYATELSGNYPNPFNPQTTISFAVKDADYTTLEVYNLKGQMVRSLIKGNMPTGYHKVVWDGKDQQGRSAGSGIYYYRMRCGTYQSTKKMLLME